MRHATLAFVVLLALPSIAAAQAAGALGDPTGATPIPPPPMATGAWETAVPASDPEIVRLRARDTVARDTSRAPHFGHSFGHAWAGFGIAGAAGALVGAGIGVAACAGDAWTCPLFGLLGASIGAIAVAPLGAGVSTWAFGSGRGGTGDGFAAIGIAYLGGGIGAGLGGLLSLVDTGVGVTVGVIAGILLTNLGAALGYQISSHGPANDDADAPLGPVIVPLAGTTSDGQGVEVGAAGAF